MEEDYRDKLLSEMNDQDKQFAYHHWNLVRDFFIDIYNKATSRVLNGLFLANGGAVLALLTYFYQRQDGADLPGPKDLFWPFLILCAGLLATIITLALDYVICFFLVYKYGKDIKNFESCEITINQSIKYRCSYICLNGFLLLFGIVAFLSFIIGASWGLCIFSGKVF